MNLDNLKTIGAIRKVVDYLWEDEKKDFEPKKKRFKAGKKRLNFFLFNPKTIELTLYFICSIYCF